MDDGFLHRELATRLGPVSRAWQRLADRVLAQFGVSNSSGWCLTHLARLGPDTRQSVLARTIGITEASLARTLGELERSGLIERRIDERDRRANQVGLTQGGAALASRIEARLAALRIDLLEGLAAPDIAKTIAMLDTIAARIEAYQERR
jgi:MarR family transcriptional regulator for hemolysin